jgi:hypothetical protein
VVEQVQTCPTEKPDVSGGCIAQRAAREGVAEMAGGGIGGSHADGALQKVRETLVSEREAQLRRRHRICQTPHLSTTRRPPTTR